MVIGISGPYSAPTEEERQFNLLNLNKAAAQLIELGHIPIIGVNAALPAVEQLESEDKYEHIMEISMAVMNVCEALYFLEESPGANREKALFETKGLPIYYKVEDIPPLN